MPAGPRPPPGSKRPPPFLGAQPSKDTVLQGYTAVRTPTSPGVLLASEKAQSENQKLHSAAFKLQAPDLRACLADDAHIAELMHELMFRSLAGFDDWDPSVDPIDPDHENVTFHQDAEENAFLLFNRAVQDAVPELTPNEHRQLEGYLRVIFDSLTFERVHRIYVVHWDNKEKFQMNGVVTLNLDTGGVRIILANRG